MHRVYRDPNLRVRPRAGTAVRELSSAEESMFHMAMSPREFVRMYEAGELGSVSWDHEQALEDYIRDVKAGKYD